MTANSQFTRSIARTAIWFSALILGVVSSALASTPFAKHPLATVSFVLGSLVLGVSWLVVAGTIGRALASTFIVLTLACVSIDPPHPDNSLGFGNSDGLISLILGSISAAAAFFLRRPATHQ
ncbi:MAG: hypothetical protein JWL59_3606 [Chthoniobacteraceae bacterium]|nr:hypothetical protein [Chthoniobacteraceae bacterium]